ncbi:MAG: hypothetical protein WAL63_19730 [Solirubrobacteraceae bacterium]
MAVDRLRNGPLTAALAGAALVVALVPAGCGSAAVSRTGSIPAGLVRQSRPIGTGAAFHPPVSGPVLGPCRRRLGRRVGAHVEVFAADRVVLVAAGIGARPPLRLSEGRITGARCFGALVTLEPTGVVLVSPRARLTVSDLFRSWGQRLSSRGIGTLQARGAARVRVFVGGRAVSAAPGDVPLTRHAEIVLEIGPYVPPHPAYRFPPGT